MNIIQTKRDRLKFQIILFVNNIHILCPIVLIVFTKYDSIIATLKTIIIVPYCVDGICFQQP